MNYTPEQRKKLELLKLRQKQAERLNNCFDPSDLDSRPTEAQLEIIKADVSINYVIGSNRSGKTMLGGRIVSWWFNDTHPYKERPAKWGDGPITILVMGQDTRNLNYEIIPRKLLPFLGAEGVDYKIKRDGGNITAISNIHNGNQIVFMTHSDAEQARRRGQGFTGHVVWCDEMPSISTIITELSLRVLTTDGYMYTTFTPLVRNDEIRKIVDSSNGVDSKKWIISILDNPAISEDRREKLVEHYRSISGSEAEFKARMYGDWLASESLVFKYDSDRNKGIPEAYDPVVWPHIVVVDPAASSLAGLTVWARHPRANVWYCVKAKYLNGSAFSDLVHTVEQECSSFNIMKRVCDCNPSGFYYEAEKNGIKYYPVSDKQYNKENMIDACNKALLEQTVYLTEGSQPLADELAVCSRHEDDPSRIIKASKYHTADCFRYFIHTMPKYEPQPLGLDRDQRIRYDWKKRQAEQSDKMKKKAKKEMARKVRRVKRKNRGRRA